MNNIWTKKKRIYKNNLEKEEHLIIFSFCKISSFIQANPLELNTDTDFKPPSFYFFIEEISFSKSPIIIIPKQYSLSLFNNLNSQDKYLVERIKERRQIIKLLELIFFIKFQTIFSILIRY